MEDYKVAKGVIADNVFIIKRKDKEVKKYGGNDFMIFTSDKNLSYMIDKYYWGIFKNDSLFINCKPKYIYYVMDMKKGKTKRLTKNRMNELLLFDEQLANQYFNEPYPKIANTQRRYLMEYKKNLYAE